MENSGLVVALVSAIRQLDDDELPAFNNPVQMFGKIPPANYSYKKALELGLIDERGAVGGIEEMRAASTLVVEERVKKLREHEG